jgi:hypothetical protein
MLSSEQGAMPVHAILGIIFGICKDAASAPKKWI